MKRSFRFNEESFFVCLLTVVVAILLFKTFELTRAKVAFFPKLIGIPLFIALLWQTAKSIFPALHDASKKSQDQLEEMEEEGPVIRKRRNVFALWILLYIVLTVLSNFMISTLVSFLIFFIWYAKISWWKAAIVTIGMLGFTYLFFDLLLGVRLI